MKSETSRVLVVIKFILLLLEFIVTLTAVVERHENVVVGMRPLINIDEYNSAQTYVIVFGILSLLFQFFEIGLNMAALNIHFDKWNSILCIYHFIGFGAFLFYLFDRWHYKSIMYLWVIFVFLPLLLEIFIAVIGFCYYGIYESFQIQKKRAQIIQEFQKKKLEEERLRQENENEEELQQLQPQQQ